MRCAMDDASNSIGCVAQRDWHALESLPEIDYRRNGIEGWERLRQRAIGTALAREAGLPYLAGVRLVGQSPSSRT
jgi:hypothetical protein